MSGELTRLERSTPYRTGVALAYLVLNTSLNMLNKWALGKYKFRFPMLLVSDPVGPSASARAAPRVRIWERVCLRVCSRVCAAM